MQSFVLVGGLTWRTRRGREHRADRGYASWMIMCRRRSGILPTLALESEYSGLCAAG